MPLFKLYSIAVVLICGLEFVTSSKPFTFIRCAVSLFIVVLLVSTGRYFLTDDE